jgi:hypothetical protein
MPAPGNLPSLASAANGSASAIKATRIFMAASPVA